MLPHLILLLLSTAPLISSQSLDRDRDPESDLDLEFNYYYHQDPLQLNLDFEFYYEDSLQPDPWTMPMPKTVRTIWLPTSTILPAMIESWQFTPEATEFGVPFQDEREFPVWK